MARDRTARIRIRQYLATAGPIADASGHATSALKEAIDYQGSSVAFIQLIAAMDRDGEITREIRGKRTYSISGVGAQASATPNSHAASTAQLVAPTTAGTETLVEIDYNRLAKALVRELLGHVAGATVEAAAVDTSENERLAAERDEYARRLEIARDKLDELLGGEVAASRGSRVPETA